MTVMVSQAAAFGFGEWGARGDGGQMTAEDQLIPSTLPLILGWNFFFLQILLKYLFQI